MRSALSPFSLLLLFALGCDNSQSTRARAVITAEPTALDFGKQTGGTKTEKTVTIGNEGRATLNISSIAIKQDTRSAFSVSGDVTAIAPGGRETLTVSYGAPAREGADGASLTIASDAENTLALIISLAGRSEAACVPKTCVGLGLNCGPVPDGCGGTLNCGSCTAPQTCAGGGAANVCGCTGETDATFCSRQGKNCGPVSGPDNCGITRTADCGVCNAPESCGGGGTQGVCACAPETNGAFCGRLGRNCDSVTAADNCGAQRTANCGVCTGNQSCGGSGVPNVCGCAAETNAAFCTRLGKSCGSVSGTDNCGVQRSVSSCGTCVSPETCGATNVCACVAESDSAFCSRVGANCGQVTAQDNCGATRTVTSCGTCTTPETCGGGASANVCGCTAETSTAFCSRLGKNCGSVTANDNCGTSRTASCGSCGGTDVCTNNVCTSCTPETDAAFCSRNAKSCGGFTGNDNCGQSRTASCGTNCWFEAPQMTVARSFPGLASSDGKLWVVGGAATSGGSTTSLERFDPSTQLWATLASAPRSAAFGGFVPANGVIYYISGCNGSDCNAQLTSAVDAYTVSTNSWSPKAAIPTARNSFSTARVGDFIYVIGGRGQCPPCTATASVEAYDTVNNSWSSRTALPVARHSHDAVAFNGKIYVVGGVTTSEQNSVVVYDPVLNSWSPGVAMPTTRQAMGAAAIATGFFAIGGFQSGTYLTVNEFFDGMAWSTKAALPLARYEVEAAEVGGYIYVTGSTTGNTPSSRVHVYVP